MRQPGRRTPRLELLEPRQLLTGAIGNLVWLDTDRDGVQDPGERGAQGAVVELYRSLDTTIGNGDDVRIGQQISAEDGSYLFSGLAGGNYYLRVRPPVGFNFSPQDAGTADTADSDVSAIGLSNIITLGDNVTDDSRDVGLIGTAAQFGVAFRMGSGNGASGNGFVDHGRAVVTDIDGNFYLTGSFLDTTDFDPGPGTFNLTSNSETDVFVAKYTAGGALIWARSFQGNLNPDDGPVGDQGRGLAIDGTGNVYVSGTFRHTVNFGSTVLTSNGEDDVFVAKLDPGGGVLWAVGFGGAGVEENTGLAIDAAGNVYTAGRFIDSVDFNPGPGTSILNGTSTGSAYVHKLNTDGVYQWARTIRAYEATDIAADSAGNVYYTGAFAGTLDVDPGPAQTLLTAGSASNVFVSKLDTAGLFVWGGAFRGNGENRSLALTLDPAGHVYTVGYFEGVVDLDPGPATFSVVGVAETEGFLTRLNNDGNFVWARTLRSVEAIEITDVAIGPTGEVYSVGTIVGPVDFDPSPLSAILDGGSLNGFQWRLSPGGNYRDAVLTNLRNAGDIRVHPTGDVYMTGNFTGTIDFDPTLNVFPLSSAGGSDIVAIRYASNSEPTADDQMVTVLEDVVAPIILTGDDGDTNKSQLLTYWIDSLPATGTLTSTIGGPAITFNQLPFRLPTDTVFFQTAQDDVSPQSFQFFVQDDAGTLGGGDDTSQPAVVDIEVTPVNDPPRVAAVPSGNPLEFIVAEDQETALTLTALDGDPEVVQLLTFTLTSLPQTGTLSESPGGPAITLGDLPRVLSGPTVYFRPALDDVTTQTFSVIARDDGGIDNGGIDTSLPGTVTVRILPLNDRPIANPQTVTAFEDIELAVTLTGDDGDDDQVQSLSFQITTLPATGTLSAVPSGPPLTLADLPFTLPTFNVFFRTAPNDVTGQTFTFRVRDNGGTLAGGIDTSFPAAVTVNITPVNDRPFLSETSVNGLEDQLLSIVLAGDDGDPELSQALTYTLLSLPAAGELRQSVSGAVIQPGDLPLALGQNLLFYQPAPNDHQTHTLDLLVRDNGGQDFGGRDTSFPTTLQLVIQPVNDRPTATSQVATVLEDRPQPILLTGDDGDPAQEQQLTFILSSLPAAGQLSQTSGGPAISPADLPLTLDDPELFIVANETAPQSFLFRVRDDGGTANGGQDTSLDAVVNVNITPVNDPPRADSQTIVALEDSELALTLTGVDGDLEVAQQLTYILTSIPFEGTLRQSPGGTPINLIDLPLTLANQTLYFTPALNNLNSQSFQFIIRDDGGKANGGNDTSLPATVSIQMQAVNDPPIANPQTVGVLENSSVAITLTGQDGDAEFAQALSYVLTSLPAAGTLAEFAGGPPIVPAQLPLVLADPQIVYTTTPNSAVPQSFTFRVMDDGGTANGGQNTSTDASVSIQVTPVNSRPVAFAQNVTALEDTPRLITLSGDDGDPETEQNLTYFISTLPTTGTLYRVDGTIILPGHLPLKLLVNQVQFLSATNSTAPQSFRFFVRDDSGTANGGADTSFTAAVNIQVDPTNDPPVIAAPNQFQVPPAVAAPLIGLAVSDIDSGASNVELQLVVAHGVLTVNTGITGGVNGGQVIASGGPVLLLRAPIGAIAVTLASGGVRYQGNAGFVGPDTLAVTVRDGGATGAGPEGVATRSVPVIVGQSSPWQNPRNRLDVNDNNVVSAGDALSVVNYINANPNNSLPPSPPQTPPPYFDVNGDSLITGGDVLAVVNFLNGVGAGEGESAGAAGAAASEFQPAVWPGELRGPRHESLLSAATSERPAIESWSQPLLASG
ncbi:MAG: hypothetical protein J5I93_31060, partial [Pirellulaceae bacterium]|nr:hypothetical protein [Pirellulaceae bacterium]